MTKLKEIYKCQICGNIVEVLHTGQGELVCCGQPMDFNEQKNKDVGKEKHVPVLVEEGGKTVVKVGEELHPMKKEHFIEWIEVIYKSGKTCRIFLKPGDEPKVEFASSYEVAKVREYCNIHGLWANN